LRPVASLPSIREIAVVFFRHKRSVLAALLLPPILLVALAYTIKPVYEADTRILVRPAREFVPRPEAPGPAPSILQTTMREMVDTVMQTATSLDLIREVLHTVGIARLYPEIAARDLEPAEIEERALRAFRDDLTAWPVRLTNIIEIKLRNTDRALAEEALAVVVDRFQERHVQAYSSSRTQFLEAEIRNNLDKLAEVQAERTRYIAERNLINADEQRSLLVQRRNSLVQELRDAEMRSAMLESQIAFLREELQRHPPTITLSNTVQASDAAVAAGLRLHEMRQRMQETSETYGSNHPMARSARAALQAAEQAVRQTAAQTRAVSSGINPLHTALLQQLATTEAERTPLAGRIASLHSLIAQDDARLHQISVDEVHLRSLNTRIAEIETANANLSQRLTDARVIEDLDRAKVAGLSLIQAPRADSKPVSPKKILFAAAGLALGFLSSGFVLLLALTFSNRFIAAESIERIVGVPVILTLPALEKPRRQARLASATRRIGGSA